MSVAEAKESAKAMLADPKKFDAEFEKIFKKYDKNFDKHIDEGEYFNFNAVMSQFERADKNKDGKISKEEFKVEVKKKLDTFAHSK